LTLFFVKLANFQRSFTDNTPIKGDKRRGTGFRRLLKTDPFVIDGTFLLTLSVLFLVAYLHPYIIVISVGTMLLTILSAWTWWRITEIYFDFLYQVGESESIERASPCHPKNTKERPAE
jgi:hypothetical protein